MISPRITIGLATFNDWEGVWATVQSVFLHNDWDSPNDVEVIIVDTSPPGSEHRRLVQGLAAQHGGGIKYLSLEGVVGTTLPRDTIFQHASAPTVVVMDCHVMCPPNTLKRAMEWFEANPDTPHLYHGPMFYDSLTNYAVQVSDQFRGHMWGTWARVWQSPNGVVFTAEGEEVTDEERTRAKTGLTYRNHLTLELLPESETASWPRIPWEGHEAALEAQGFKSLGGDIDDPPFEICGMGMGLWAVRKDAWLGFAPGCTAFGGEEMSIHYKYRQAGHKVFCLPFLRWNHRFGRVGGAPYPIPVTGKIRNYMLWSKHLGNPRCPNGELLQDRIMLHFHSTITPDQWSELLSSPEEFQVPLGIAPPTQAKPLDALFQRVATTPRDLNENAEALRALAANQSTKRVAAFVKRAEWNVILAAGFPNSLAIYNTEHNNPLVRQSHEAHRRQEAKDNRILKQFDTYAKPMAPAEVDLLVYDLGMSAEELTPFLTAHGPLATTIIIRGTGAFGNKAEGSNNPGMYASIKEFLEANPTYFVAQHTNKQYGYTVLSKEGTPPSPEIKPWPKGYGPGTSLKSILGSIGINPSPSCSCNSRMLQMDEWGVEGCEANFDVIVGWLEESAEKWGWNNFIRHNSPDELSLREKLKVGWKSVTSGLAFKINPLNPYPGLVQEAIDRSKK